MARDGVLRLKMVDVYGNPLKERVDILLRHQTLSHSLTIKSKLVPPAGIKIQNLHGAPQGIYRLFIDPPSYLPVHRFVNLKASGITDLKVRFPIDAEKVTGIDFPAYAELVDELRQILERSNQVLSFENKTGEELYGGLDDIRKAGLLNISAKAGAVLLNSGRTVFAYLESLREIRGDRVFAFVPAELLLESKNSISSGLFKGVSGGLHPPPPGFDSAGSFKTDDLYGNLQLTFFQKEHESIVEIDIDDANGIEHIFQVARNHLTGNPTHPYNIHQILIGHQELDPRYHLQV